MPLVVNTNVSSLTVQRNLDRNQSDAATAFQRLSSGLRINSAKDDAAGLAISNRFTAQINGLNQAIRNSGDGISLAQTAEGALGEIGNNLQRIRELAVQSSNATNSASDRVALQTEVDQLLLEIDRVADNTSFNGVKLLDGSFTGQVFQVGANAGESITISNIVDANTAAIGSVSEAGGAALVANISTITASGTAISSGDVTINGQDLGAIAAGTGAADRAGQLVNAINNISQITGVGASYDANSGEITLNSEAAVTVAGALNDAAVAGFANGTLGVVSTTSGINSLTVANYAGAQTAIKLVDSALTAINSGRATLGAVQSRFESTVSSLATTAENLTASRSRIQDADFAAETASLTRSQILQQAGISVLSQANSAPQNVLALLQ